MYRIPRSGVLSRWHLLIENFQTSALDFYSSVEEAIRAREIPDLALSRVEWHEKGILSAKRTYLRIERGRLSFDICAAPYGKGYFFSWWLARRTSYQGLVLLCLLLGGLVGFSFYLLLVTGSQTLTGGCAIFVLLALAWVGGLPVGLYLLGKAVEQGSVGNEEAVLATPFIGFLYELFFNPYSYYQLDTAAMFQDSVAQAVWEVVDRLREEHGLPPLTDAEVAPGDRVPGQG